MPQTSEAGRVRLGTDLKSFSCLICRQRKVKCDRRNPCSNCTRAARQCSFIPPVRGKPKGRKTPKEGLHAKLRRYEEMLKSYGADLEPSDNDNISDMGTMSEADIEMAEDSKSRDESRSNPFEFDNTKTRLISKNGSSRYFDSGLWSKLGDALHHPEEDSLHESVDESKVQGSDLSADSSEENGLVLNAFSKFENLASLHHPLHILQKMLDFYVDRVDPLTKLLHIPTFWPTLTSALENPHEMSKSLEAIIFAFYLTTISSLDDDECFCLLGEQKSIISARYQNAARQALINASFLRTSSLMTLQAYVLFLISMRGHYASDSLFILSGIAVRLARRMGLHRDGTLLGLSPFETENRRRLWWHIVHVDCRISDYQGTKPSMDLFISDTKRPLNVEDEDLSPDMANPPPERTGITSVVLCLIRCDVMDFLRKLAPELGYGFRWENLSDPNITLTEKDNMITEIEDALERKYLRYHDPTNPLHCFSAVMARYSVCKMKLFAHSPRQFASCGVKIPQGSRDIIFASGTKLMEYGNLIHRNQIIRKFMWQIGTGYLWDALLYVLIEVRDRKVGPKVDHVWQLISGMFESHPAVLLDTTDALYAAVRNWTLQVWDDCVAARKVEGLPEFPTPEYITAIRCCQKPSAESSSKKNGLATPERAIRNSTGCDEVQFPGFDGNPITNLDPIDSYDFSNLLSFDLEPNDWVQWERLFSGKGVWS